MNISLNSSCPSLYPFSYHNSFYCFLKDGGAKKGDVGVMSIGVVPMDPDFLRGGSTTHKVFFPHFRISINSPGSLMYTISYNSPNTIK